MKSTGQPSFHVAIACGGTGGHLFPGLAVAEQLVRRGGTVTLLVSPKEVDQQAIKAVQGMNILTLPAIGLTRGRVLAFARGFAQSYQTARRHFRPQPPVAALAMGGFTSAPPLLAAKRLGAKTFFHESNTIPGRANRWLAWVVDEAFIGFPSAAELLRRCRTTVTGTPVRPQFQSRDAAQCRAALGLDPARPLVLVMGGSQGASGVNELVLKSLPILARQAPEWQWMHLTGPKECERVRQAYAALNLSASVHPFFDRMELAMGAAAAAVSRAGASSLAEIAALRLPSILVPFPAAMDNHQFYNARAFEATGAARLLEQKSATPETLAAQLVELVRNDSARGTIQSALAQWHSPDAAEKIAAAIVGDDVRSPSACANGRQLLECASPLALSDSSRRSS